MGYTQVKIKKLFHFFLYSNLFISVCAACFTVETYLLIGAEINWSYSTFVFFSTLVLYNFPVLQAENFLPEYSERHTWVSENKKPVALISAIAFAGSVATIFFFPFKFILLFAPVASMALAYFFPQTQLRSIAGLKTAIVAFVWVSITGIFPLLLTSHFEWHNSFGNGRATVLLQNFFFIFPLCAIFNVRDVEVDRYAGVKTFPVIYGVKKTILLCLVSLFIFSTIVLFSPALKAVVVLQLLLSATFSAALILTASPAKKDYYYSFWIDGMILLQAGLVALSSPTIF